MGLPPNANLSVTVSDESPTPAQVITTLSPSLADTKRADISIPLPHMTNMVSNPAQCQNKIQLSPSRDCIGDMRVLLPHASAASPAKERVEATTAVTTAMAQAISPSHECKDTTPVLLPHSSAASPARERAEATTAVTTSTTPATRNNTILVSEVNTPCSYAAVTNVTTVGVTSKPSNEDEWKLVKRRSPKNRFEGKIGKAKVDGNSKFRAADTMIPLFISNVAKETTPQDVSDYIFNKTKLIVKPRKINMRKERAYNAYKILVPKHKVSIFVDNDLLWPDGISFRRFVYINKQSSPNKSPGTVDNKNRYIILGNG